MKKYIWIPIVAFALVIALIITMFVLWQPNDDDADDMLFTTQVYYLDSTVSDNDERLETSYVNNSATNFFVRGTQLQSQLYAEQNTTTPYRVTFYDRYSKHTDDATDMTRPFSKVLHITRDVQETVDGTTPTGTSYVAGEEIPFAGLYRIDGRYYYKLGEDRYITATAAMRLCRRTAFEGTLAHPYTVNTDQTQYLGFTGAGDYIYLSFYTDNEFISLFLSGLPEGSSWELYDSTYHKVSCRYSGTHQSEEIYYRAAAGGRFLLRINAADAANVTLEFHRDDNEWQKNMQTVSLNNEYSSVFDYYGDEDFYILGSDVAGDLGSLAMSLAGVDADLQVMAYDKNKNLVGKYTRSKGTDEEIMLYGLENVYALSVRTVDGSVRSAQYTLSFYYTDVYLLGLETYGFKISSAVEIGEDGENYYTAVCDGLTGKRISDVQTAAKSRVTMTLTTAAGMTYSFKEGEDMPLHAGKNTVTIHIENPSDERTLTLCITDRASYQLGYGFILSNGTAVYASALTTSEIYTYLKSGTKVLLSGQKQNNLVKIETLDGSGIIGWVQQSKIFDDYEICDMPDSYASAIRKLQKKHPQWIFTFVRVGKTLDEAVNTEMRNSPIVTSSNWRSATRSEVYYYMDPLNFLNEEDIFMFEKQTYHEGTYSQAGVAAIWSEKDGALYGENYYVKWMLEAGKVAGLSPYFIAARAALESGNGTSALSKGTVTDYEGYYNFYGINAVDSNPKNGAVYAKQQNWYTQRISIIEGAVWIKSQYISALQYTPYFIKYSFVPDRNWHQYMTDISAPLSDASQCYKAHKAGGTLNSAIEFVIPVFN